VDYLNGKFYRRTKFYLSSQLANEGFFRTLCPSILKYRINLAIMSSVPMTDIFVWIIYVNKKLFVYI